MFRTNAAYQAHCAACDHVLIDHDLDYEEAPLLIPAGEPLPVLTGTADSDEGLWAVIDGRLLCPDCLPAPAEDATAQEGLEQALTPVTYYTFHCRACAEPLLDADDGPDEPWRFETPALEANALDAMTYLAWDLVETTPPPSQAVLVETPDAPERTWQATCRDCIDQAAWQHDLAATAA